jgi:hypothetical protein
MAQEEKECRTFYRNEWALATAEKRLMATADAEARAYAVALAAHEK